MDTARTPRGVVPRLVARVLFVLGGAVLATVVGWLISSATASAAGLPSVPLPHNDDGVVHAVVHDVVAPLVRQRLPGRAADGVRGVLGSAVSELRTPPDPIAAVPPHVLPATPAATPTPVRTSRATGHRTSDRVASVAAADVPPPAHGGTVSTRFRTDRSPVAAPRHLPTRLRPATPQPWHPASVPGGAGASCCGGVGFGTESGALPTPRLRVLRVLTRTAPAGRHVPGRQPGTTPD